MPTVLLIDGYRFFFYSNEGDEPAHVHVAKGEGVSKWWLEPASEATSSGFKPAQRRKIADLVGEHRDTLLRAWHEHFER